jgi:hypothetical protein
VQGGGEPAIIATETVVALLAVKWKHYQSDRLSTDPHHEVLLSRGVTPIQKSMRLLARILIWDFNHTLGDWGSEGGM